MYRYYLNEEGRPFSTNRKMDLTEITEEEYIIKCDDWNKAIPKPEIIPVKTFEEKVKETVQGLIDSGELNIKTN
jgi:hypothetical protein